MNNPFHPTGYQTSVAHTHSFGESKTDITTRLEQVAKDWTRAPVICTLCADALAEIKKLNATIALRMHIQAMRIDGWKPLTELDDWRHAVDVATVECDIVTGSNCEPSKGLRIPGIKPKDGVIGDGVALTSISHPGWPESSDISIENVSNQSQDTQLENNNQNSVNIVSWGSPFAMNTENWK